MGRILLVEDESILLGTWSRFLEKAGFSVTPCNDSTQAVRLLETQEYNAVLSDVFMPGLTGLDLLKEVRQHDPDLPVVLVSGIATLDSALQAVEHRAFQYLLKPVDGSKLVSTITQAVNLNRLAKIKREAFQALHRDQDMSRLEASFTRAMRSVWPAFQPVFTRNGDVYAYEALLRTKEASFTGPEELIRSAEKLGKLSNIFQAMKSKAVAAFQPKWGKALLFLNIHPEDLLDEDLLNPDSPIGRHASHIVLEITERYNLDAMCNIRNQVAYLRSLGYSIAIDDLGAGYAGLNSFMSIEPEFVKLDMALIRGIHESPLKQRIVKMVTELCRELTISVVAEGIQTAQERDIILDLGCDLFQGYFLGPPAAFPS